MLKSLLSTVLAKYKKLIWIVIVFQAIQAMAGLYLPTLNADIINNGVVKHDIGYIWTYGGIMLLVTFALLSNAMLFAETKQYMLKPMTILPVFMLVFLTTFEVLVGFLQAFIFTILTGVYIGQAKHPAH